VSVICVPGSLQDGEITNLSCSVPDGIGSFGKLEAPNAKKKHRRIKSSSRSSDLNLDAGIRLRIQI